MKNQINIFQGNWMVKIGVVLLVLSIGWLVTYAFSNDIIGPTGRVVMGIVFGVGLLVWGAKWLERSSIQGIFIVSGGAISIYIALFAGMALYDFYGPILTLFVMSLVCLYFAILSIVKKQKKLGFALLTFGLLAPLFVVDSLENPNTIFVYLFILSSGVITVDYFLKWRGTTVFALLGVLLYSLVLGMSINETTLTHFIFVVLFVLLFFITSFWFVIHSRKVTSYDLILIALLGFSYFVWMSLFIPEEMFGIGLVGGALIFTLAAYGGFFFTSIREPVFLYGCVSLGLLLGATTEFLSGTALAVVLLLELAGTLIGHYMLIKGEFVKTRILFFLLLIWPIALSFISLRQLHWYTQREIVSENVFTPFFVIFVFSLVFSLLSWIIWKYNTNKEDETQKAEFYASFITAIFYAIAFVWFLLHILAPSYYVGSMLSLIVFSLIGAVFYVWGSFGASRGILSQLGVALIVLVLLRLFFVEFWDMEMIWKIITFFVVGSILVLAAVLFNKNKESLQ